MFFVGISPNTLKDRVCIKISPPKTLSALLKDYNRNKGIGGGLYTWDPQTSDNDHDCDSYITCVLL